MKKRKRPIANTVRHKPLSVPLQHGKITIRSRDEVHRVVGLLQGANVTHLVLDNCGCMFQLQQRRNYNSQHFWVVFVVKKRKGSWKHLYKKLQNSLVEHLSIAGSIQNSILLNIRIVVWLYQDVGWSVALSFFLQSKTPVKHLVLGWPLCCFSANSPILEKNNLSTLLKYLNSIAQGNHFETITIRGIHNSQGTLFWALFAF